MNRKPEKEIEQAICNIPLKQIPRKERNWKELKQSTKQELNTGWRLVSPSLPPLEKFLAISNSYEILNRRVALQLRV